MKPGFTFYVWYVYSRSLRWHHIIFPKQYNEPSIYLFFSRKYKRVALLCIKAEEKRVRVTHHVKTSCAGPPFIRLQDKSLGLGTLHKTVDLSPPSLFMYDFPLFCHKSSLLCSSAEPAVRTSSAGVWVRAARAR